MTEEQKKELTQHEVSIYRVERALRAMIEDKEFTQSIGAVDGAVAMLNYAIQLLQVAARYDEPIIQTKNSQ